MALAKVTINKGEGGLGQPAAGEDYISGVVLYDNTLPSGFTSSTREKVVFSLEEAEGLGIVNTYADATSASGGGFTVTAVGANGDKIEVKVDTPSGVVSLGTYTKVSGDTTVANVATGIRAAINEGTADHGYTAGGSSAVVSLTAPKSYGVFNNGSGTTNVITGTITVGTATNFSSGVASKLAQYHYYVSEYFRMNPTGQLYIGFYDVPASYTFTDVTTLQTFASGKIRQCAVIPDRTLAYASGQVTALQSVVATNETNEAPLEIIYSPAFDAETIGTVSDLSTLTASNVSVVAFGDDNGQGKFLRQTGDVTISAIGAVLGAVSSALVSENIAWVSEFNFSNGTELEKVVILKDTAYSTVTNTTLASMENKRYLVARKFIGQAGTYVTDDVTAVASTSDYSNIRLNRAINKAIRNVRAVMTPRLNQPLVVQSGGTLTGDVIDDFKTTCETPLDAMQTALELSEYSVVINGSQNVLSTGEVIITIKIIPVGSAKFITINIGFTTTL